MVKQTLDAQACGTGTGLTPCERVAIYPYPGDFERHGLRRGLTTRRHKTSIGLTLQA